MPSQTKFDVLLLGLVALLLSANPTVVWAQDYSGASVERTDSPLSGSVRIIDQVNRAPMRLKRVQDSAANIPASFPTTNIQAQPASVPASTPASIPDSSPAKAPSSLSATSSGDGLQALFPSKDAFAPAPQLSGQAVENAQPAAKKKHQYIWNMSLAGGYYDATGVFQGVVPGDKLYLYGGFMADGHTPVPSGPQQINAGGHIRWTPIMGAPPPDN